MPIGQGELDKVLEDTEITGRGRLEKKYSIGSLFKLGQLKALLRKNIIQDHRLNLISSHAHDVGLFKDGDKYFFFDPNCKTGEILVSSDQLEEGEVATDKLAEIIFEKFGFLDGSKPSPISFRIFAFDERPLPLSPQNILAEINPDINPEGDSYKKYTGLMMAATVGSLESVEYFLDIDGVDINAQDKDGWTALMHAVGRGHIEVAAELLKHNAAYSIKNNNYATIFEVAAAFGYSSIVRELLPKFGDFLINLTGLIGAMEGGWLETIKVILDGKPHLLRAKFTGAENLLMYAAKVCKYPEIIRELLDRGIYFGLRNGEGLTALMIAAKHGNSVAFKVLLDVETSRWDKRKALMLAVSNGHLDVVKELLVRGVDSNIVNVEGETALMVAERHGHSTIIEELKRDRVVADFVFNVLFGGDVFREEEQNKIRKDINKLFSLVYSDKEYAANHPLIKYIAAQYLLHSEWITVSSFLVVGGIKFPEDFKCEDFSWDLGEAIIGGYKAFNESELGMIQDLSSSILKNVKSMLVTDSVGRGLPNRFIPYFDMIITSDLISRCNKPEIKQHLENILASEEDIERLGGIYIEAFKRMKDPRSIKIVLDELDDEFLRAFFPPEQRIEQHI